MLYVRDITLKLVFAKCINNIGESFPKYIFPSAVTTMVYSVLRLVYFVVAMVTEELGNILLIMEVPKSFHKP